MASELIVFQQSISLDYASFPTACSNERELSHENRKIRLRRIRNRLLVQAALGVTCNLLPWFSLSAEQGLFQDHWPSMPKSSYSYSASRNDNDLYELETGQQRRQ